ncbi:MAG: hypothetical protein KAU20_02390 [Nanoarchaeota archaeon]|nr:hypothetical protein [Nanoarchaeota archaeon]
MDPYEIVKVYESAKTVPEFTKVLVDKGVHPDIANKLCHVIDAAADKWEVDLSASSNKSSPKYPKFKDFWKLVPNRDKALGIMTMDEIKQWSETVFSAARL